MSDGKIHPVYVNGPLAGQDFPVDGATLGRGVQAIDWPRGENEHPRDLIAHTVSYCFRQYAIFGRVIWIGTLKRDPDEPNGDDMAEHMLSDAAKRAVRPLPPTISCTPAARS